METVTIYSRQKSIYDNRLRMQYHWLELCKPGTSCGAKWKIDLYYLGNGNLSIQDLHVVPLESTTELNPWRQEYTYDGVNRLKQIKESRYFAGVHMQRDFGYDAWGNRAITSQIGLSSPPGINAFSSSTNRLTTAPVAYDAAGNLTKDTVNRQMGYDAENRTIRFDDISSMDSNDRRYVYDGLGRRVRKTTALSGNGVDTLYIYDAFGNLGAEYSETGSLPVGIQFPTTDHLGSTRIVTDYGGGVVSRHDFTPFGEEIPSNVGNRTEAGDYGQPGLNQKFTGQFRDTESTLDYFGARYFSSPMGRFTSPDPLLASGRPDQPQSWNRYAYVLNNPLRYVDGTGMYEEDVHRDLTVALALAAGISEPIATRIGAADQGVDDNPRTSPMGMSPGGEAAEIREAYHFTTPQRRAELYGRFESTGSPERLGVFFHAQQDSYSHAGYGARFGHAVDGHAPDKTYLNSAKADRMAANAFAILTDAAPKLMNGGQYRPLSAKQVEKFTSAFNRARTAPAKQRVLNTLIQAARDNIQRQENERRKREEDRR